MWLLILAISEYQNVNSNAPSEPNMPSQEEMNCFTAMMQLRQTCSESPFPELTGGGPGSERAIYNKLVEMHLQELCG
jgi:hypothetical protein